MAFDLSSIQRTKRLRAPKIVIAGPGKIGKTTFAADAPNSVGILTEDGADAVDAAAKVRFLKSSRGMIGSATLASTNRKRPMIASPPAMSPATSGVANALVWTLVRPIRIGMIPAANVTAPRKSIVCLPRPRIVGSSTAMIDIAIVLGVSGARLALRGASRAAAWFYIGLAVFTLWLTFGPDAGLYTALYYTVPVFSFLRAPSRAGVVVVLCLVVLAAPAMVAIMKRRGANLAFAILLVLAPVWPAGMCGISLPACCWPLSSC